MPVRYIIVVPGAKLSLCVLRQQLYSLNLHMKRLRHEESQLPAYEVSRTPLNRAASSEKECFPFFLFFDIPFNLNWSSRRRFHAARNETRNPSPLRLTCSLFPGTKTRPLATDFRMNVYSARRTRLPEGTSTSRPGEPERDRAETRRRPVPKGGRRNRRSSWKSVEQLCRTNERRRFKNE